MTKICRNCGETKPLEDFYIHKAMGDGHLNKCKTCVKARVRGHRWKHIDRIRWYDKQRAMLPHRVEMRKAYLKNNPVVKRKINARQRARFPERYAANDILNNAVRCGKVKPQTCIKCGRRAHGHHEDYRKPLDVTWLCPKHHKERHRELKRLGVKL